jgi:predicted PurR-regulated permease PerM
VTVEAPQPPPRPLLRRLRRYLAPTLLLGVLAFVIVAFRHVMVPFILALIVVYLIEPVVKRLHRVRVAGWFQLPRWSAVVLVYLTFFGAVSLFSLLVVPPLAGEFSKLAAEAPRFFEDLRREHIPALNRDLQSLVGRIFPVELDEADVEAARAPLHEAVARAESVSALHGLLTSEERALLSLGGGQVTIDEVRQSNGEPVAFRIRVDPESGEYVVLLEEVEMLAHPTREGSFILRTSSHAEPPPRAGGAGPHFDLERELNETLVSLAERSGEGVAELVSLGQGVAVGLLGAFVSIILTFMVAAFVSIDLPGILAYFRNTIPVAARQTYDDLLRQLDRGLAGVVRGQLLICLVNGTLTAIGLLLFDVKFALILALFATILSLIPIFGTIISTIPAVAMALTDGFSVALLVLAWILMIHFIEANILNPKIIGTQAHIHPAIVVFALLAGEHTYGLLGALLAVPVASIFLTIFKFVLSRSVEGVEVAEERAT